MIAGLRAALVLALVCVSLISFGWQLFSDDAFTFARANLLPFVARKALLQTMVGGGAIALLAGLAYLGFRGSRGVVSLRRAARLLSPLALIAFVPPLLLHDVTEALLTGIAYAVFTLLLERLLRVSFSAAREISGATGGSGPGGDRTARRLGALVALAAAIFYAVYMSMFTVFLHRRFQTYNYDLGQYDNIFWNTLHGRPLRCTPLGAFTDWSSLSGHADISVFFLLPFYAIRPHAETLLILQSSILGLGAIPVYLLAARRLPAAYAVLLSICYLLYPPLHGANLYDFHFQPIASTFVLFTILFADRRKWILCAIAYVLAICCREDISVGLAVFGLYLLLTRYRPVAGAIMAAGGVAYFVVMRFYIMSRFGQGWFSDIYKELYPGPDGPNTYAGLMTTLATNPFFVFRSLLTQEKLRYFLQIATPIAFLPLRRAYLLPALLPGAIFTLLTTGYPATIDIGFQYSGHFTPYIFAASAFALAAYRQDRSATMKLPAAASALAIAALLCTKQWGAFPPTGTVKGGFVQVYFARPAPADEQKARDLAELAAMIPETANFAASEEELPHVSGRLNVLTLKYGVGPAEYLLYGTGSTGADVGVRALEAGEFYELASRPGLFLLKSKPPSPAR